MPQPKAKKGKKKKEEPATAEPDSPKKAKSKKKKGKASDLPPPVVWTTGADLSIKDAMSTADCWNSFNQIQQKLSQGCLTTATFNAKTSTFDRLNPCFEKSPILP